MIRFHRLLIICLSIYILFSNIESWIINQSGSGPFSIISWYKIGLSIGTTVIKISATRGSQYRFSYASSSLSTIIGIFYDLDGHNRESLKYVINRVARLNRYGTKGVTTINSSSFSFIRPRIPKSWILNHKWTSNSFPSHLSSFLLPQRHDFECFRKSDFCFVLQNM